MDIKRYIDQIPHIRKIVSYAKKEKDDIYLVGGFLRDICLKRKKHLQDFDFAVFQDARRVAEWVVRSTGGSLVILDEDTKSYRVVCKARGIFYRYDFTNFRAPTVEGDLRRRDFTINTLAVRLNPYPRLSLEDYTDGLNDLRKKRIRSLSEDTFRDDPLRILRAFSLSSSLGFRIDSSTFSRIRKTKDLLPRVSAERISEELFKVFQQEKSFAAIKQMSDTEILDEIFPEIRASRSCTQGDYHHLLVWDHSLLTLRKFGEILKRKNFSGAMSAYLDETISGQRKRTALLKLSCLLHDIGKPAAKKQKKGKTIFYEHERLGRSMVEAIGLRLKLSLKERQFLKTAVFWHLRPGCLVQNTYPTSRAVYRYFRDTEPEGVGIILLSIADWRATLGKLVDLRKRAVHERILFKLIEDYFASKQKKEIIPLIRGDEIMKKFHIPESVLVGKVLKKIREEQAIGNISTKAEAYKQARKVIVAFRKF
jgi:poly(A) polymerase